MLQANEVLSRHLFTNRDGKTSVPHCFTASIGKLLQNCERSTVRKFDFIEVPSVIIDATNLSLDRNIFLKFMKLYQVAEFRKILESVRWQV